MNSDDASYNFIIELFRDSNLRRIAEYIFSEENENTILEKLIKDNDRRS